ncbi:hypothetical protein RGV33_33050 [Pseudomonas sp. Bout1]|uniref:hypothetical protein n=1 Tax=Pseudomonas sp. Bout1 TaxID=3048600 RepID=UPI002AB586C7|nr:hypothetical protein [Pseudomonas sp. Bout1]MDY7536451.1 hypothetical protein [Pseudomonas sp. Bout1]MEB0187486.1 hypothetical protein [Pseudomonas sp. Bout1]
MKLNAVIFKFGLIVQVLVLVAFLFPETAVVLCSDKNNINLSSELGSNFNEDKASLRMKSNEQNSFFSLMSLEFSSLEKTLDNADFKNTDSMTAWLKYLLVAGGLMGLVGLLMMALRRKKTRSIISVKPFHLCSLNPVLVPLSYQPCNQCDTLIKYSKNTKHLSRISEIWVIEITILSAFERKKSAAAIKGMKLPVIRLENNFIIVGPYKRKLEAAKVVGDLYESHNVRGWLTPGN